MASHRPATRRQAAMSAAGPLRILCSELEARALAPQLRAGTREIRLCHPGDLDAAHAEVGFISRDITGDRKSTRLNSSHVKISYAVFCLKKKTKTTSP